MKLEEIRKINKNIVHEDGTIDSFDKQLIELISGIFDTRFPMIISQQTLDLGYIHTIDRNLPLLISVNKVIKLREKHELGWEFVSEIPKKIKHSVLAFDSLKFDTSKVIVFDEFNEENYPIMCVLRTNECIDGNKLFVNEINSAYDRKNLISYIERVFEEEKTFYKNEKTEQYFNPYWSLLPDDLKYALSDSYTRTSFTKSQVVQDIQKNKIRFEKGNKLSVAERAAKAKSIMEQRQRKKSVNNHDLERGAGM